MRDRDFAQCTRGHAPIARRAAAPGVPPLRPRFGTLLLRAHIVPLAARGAGAHRGRFRRGRRRLHRVSGGGPARRCGLLGARARGGRWDAAHAQRRRRAGRRSVDDLRPAARLGAGAERPPLGDGVPVGHPGRPAAGAGARAGRLRRAQRDAVHARAARGLCRVGRGLELARRAALLPALGEQPAAARQRAARHVGAGARHDRRLRQHLARLRRGGRRRRAAPQRRLQRREAQRRRLLPVHDPRRRARLGGRRLHRPKDKTAVGDGAHARAGDARPLRRSAARDGRRARARAQPDELRAADARARAARGHPGGGRGAHAQAAAALWHRRPRAARAARHRRRPAQPVRRPRPRRRRVRDHAVDDAGQRLCALPPRPEPQGRRAPRRRGRGRGRRRRGRRRRRLRRWRRWRR